MPLATMMRMPASVARVADDRVRPGRDHVLAAVGLDADDRREEPVFPHRPKAQRVAGGEPRPGRAPWSQAGTSSLQWKRPRSSPATIQCSNRTPVNSLSAERRLLAAGPHALAQKPGIEPGERGDDDGRENRQINPKAGDRERSGRAEQRHRRQNEKKQPIGHRPKRACPLSSNGYNRHLNGYRQPRNQSSPSGVFEATPPGSSADTQLWAVAASFPTPSIFCKVML